MNSLICNIFSPGLCDSVVYVLSFISWPQYFIDSVESPTIKQLHNEQTNDCQNVNRNCVISQGNCPQISRV